MQVELQAPDAALARREFLINCTKMAVLTPPSLSVLLATTRKNHAVAALGDGGRQDGGGVPGISSAGGDLR